MAGQNEPPEPEERARRARPGSGGENRTPRTRSRWLRALREELVFPVVAAVVAGAVVLVLEDRVIRPDSPRPVGPPHEWNTRSAAETAGVRSWGSVGELDDGRLYLTGTVEDSEPDHAPVGLQVEAVRDRNPPDVRTYPNTRGPGERVPVGSATLPAGGTGELFDRSVGRLLVQDCLLVEKPDHRYEPKPGGCGQHAVIYERKK